MLFDPNLMPQWLLNASLAYLPHGAIVKASRDVMIKGFAWNHPQVLWAIGCVALWQLALFLLAWAVLERRNDKS